MTIDFSAYGEQSLHINAFKCLKCGAIYYPAPMVCGKCDGHRDPVTGKHWEELTDPATPSSRLFELAGLDAPQASPTATAVASDGVRTCS